MCTIADMMKHTNKQATTTKKPTHAWHSFIMIRQTVNETTNQSQRQLAYLLSIETDVCILWRSFHVIFHGVDNTYRTCLFQGRKPFLFVRCSFKKNLGTHLYDISVTASSGIDPIRWRGRLKLLPSIHNGTADKFDDSSIYYQ